MCKNFPTGLAIWQCAKGHLACGNCHHMVMTKGCPEAECNSKAFTRNYFAEHMAFNTITRAPRENTPLCKFAKYGCLNQGAPATTAAHEQLCQHREVACPSSHRGNCDWKGSISQMIVHLRTKECVQILRTNHAVSQPFQSYIGDFSHSDMTVFRRTIDTHWKPVLLISHKWVANLIYLTVTRAPRIGWIFIIRSYSPAFLRETMRARLTIFKTRQSKLDPDTPIYAYSGRPAGTNDNLTEIRSAGKFMSIQDDQIQALSNGTRLFEYAIHLDLDADVRPPPPQPPAPVTMNPPAPATMNAAATTPQTSAVAAAVATAAYTNELLGKHWISTLPAGPDIYRNFPTHRQSVSPEGQMAPPPPTQPPPPSIFGIPVPAPRLPPFPRLGPEPFPRSEMEATPAPADVETPVTASEN